MKHRPDEYFAVLVGGRVYCVDCLPTGYTLDHEDVVKLYLGEATELQQVPVCSFCGFKHRIYVKWGCPRGSLLH